MVLHEIMIVTDTTWRVYCHICVILILKIKVTCVLIREMLFADDVALVSHTREHLQCLMDRLLKACKEFVFTISIKKTEVMAQDCKNPFFSLYWWFQPLCGWPEQHHQQKAFLLWGHRWLWSLLVVVSSCTICHHIWCASRCHLRLYQSVSQHQGEENPKKWESQDTALLYSTVNLEGYFSDIFPLKLTVPCMFTWKDAIMLRV